MKFFKNIIINGYSSLTKNISPGRMTYGFILGLLWGMGNVFLEWLGDKLHPEDPFWELNDENVEKQTAKFEALAPSDCPTEMLFSEDELKELEDYDTEAEMPEEEEWYMSKERFVMEVDKCNVQIKEILKKAKEEGKLPS